MATTGAKRILREAAALRADPLEDIVAQPLESDIYCWHFTVRQNTYKGLYHGKLVLPANYPLGPPDVYLMTPNGRFETNTRICLSITSFHPDDWSPVWGIRQALLALVAYWDEEGKGAIGSLETPPEERERLARLSEHYTCPVCQISNKDILPPPPQDSVEASNATKGSPLASGPQAEEAATPDDAAAPAPPFSLQEEPDQTRLPACPVDACPAQVISPGAPRAPPWIDSLLICLLCCLAGLLVKRFALFDPEFTVDS